MDKDIYKTPVIIRQYRKGGELIAIFPEEPGSHEAWTCMCYQVVGQHGHGDVNGIVEATKLVDLTLPYAQEFIKELEGIGYNLEFKKKASRKSFDIRYNKIKALYPPFLE